MDEVLNDKIQNISELSQDELSALKDDIKNRFDELNSQETRTRESVDSMTQLAGAMKSVRDETARRDEEAKELETQALAAADIINNDDEAPEEEPVEEAQEEVVEDAADEQDAEVETEDDLDDELPEAEDVEEDEEEEKVSTDFSEDSEVEPTDSDSELASEDADTKNNDNDDSEDEVDDNTDSEDESELSNNSNTESETDMATVNTEFSAPSEYAPSAKTERKTATIVAAADLRGIQSGSVIPDFRALSNAILERRSAMGRTSGGDNEQSLVASIKTDDFYEDSHTLYSTDTEGNQEKINKIVKAVADRTSAGESALVAAGGLYGPVETSYDIYKLGESLARPVKAALPSFKADRGGLRFLTPPVLADLQGAVSVWTLEDDVKAVDPSSGKEKPCIRVKAGEEVTVYIEALPLCLTFGNIGARAFPEMVERHVELAMVWQARFAEARLLERIGNLSTKVTAVSELGVARDILGQVDRAGAALRNRHRLEPNFPLKAIFPLWFKDAMRSDLIKQMPGDGQEVAFSLADATIDRWFAERNVSVTWSYDGESTQYFAEQADGALVDYPKKLVWYLFPEGTFLFLEDATLDLGLVRDSTLNATNDYKMFVETFENVAKVGVESLRIESDVAIAGAVAGTVATIGA